eukprot:scaffold6638_cov127-Cylindrotheca_fusiformis.AAC.25
MLNHPAFMDPRLMASALVQQQQRSYRSAHSARADEAQEVANFLLQLKHRNVPNGSGHHQMPRLESGIQLQQNQSSRAGNMHSLPLGYPVGSIYGYPTSTLEAVALLDRERALLAAERAPALLEESVTEHSWEKLLDGSELVLPKDRDLVPDALFVAMSQMKPCKLTQADRVGCYKSREIGFVGMCCKHCGGQPGFGRYYPNSVRSLAQTTTSQTILKHIGGKCRFCPPHVRQAVLELQRHQAAKEGMSSGRPRYGSRKIFFQRMWARLHGGKAGAEDDVSDSEGEGNSAATGVESCTELESGNESSEENRDDESQKQKFRNKRMLPTHKNKEGSSKRARVSAEV